MTPRLHLTAKRISIHGLLLALCLWTVYAVDLSSHGLRDRYGIVKGADFLHFYTLGHLARQGRGDLLYDLRAQAGITRQLVPEAPDSLYVPLYGPQVSLWFAPFARLSYGRALAAWLLLNVLIYGTCCYAVGKTCAALRPYRWTVLIAGLAFPGFFHLLMWGQTSGLALLCFTLAYLALRRGWNVLAGLAIGTLVFKPQLGLVAAAVLLLAGAWKIIAGAVLSMSAQLALAWMHYGTGVLRTYFDALLHVRAVLALLEPRLYQTHSLRSFWSLLLPWPRAASVLYAASALVAVWLALQCWKKNGQLEIRYAGLLFATVLVSPHLTVYDLVILAPAFLWLADWAAANGGGRVSLWIDGLLYACYPLFLLGPLARITHLQLSVVAMALLLWICWRIAEGRTGSLFA